MDGHELERTAVDALAEAASRLQGGYLEERSAVLAAAHASLAQAAALLLLVETVRSVAEQSGGDDEDYRAGLIETVWATHRADKAARVARERRRRDDG